MNVNLERYSMGDLTLIPRRDGSLVKIDTLRKIVSWLEEDDSPEVVQEKIKILRRGVDV